MNGDQADNGELKMKSVLLIASVILISSTSFVVGGSYGPRLLGTGYLEGWTVSINGKEICDDPYIWDSTHEIECD